MKVIAYKTTFGSGKRYEHLETFKSLKEAKSFLDNLAAKDAIGMTIPKIKDWTMSYMQAGGQLWYNVCDEITFSRLLTYNK
jgi:hypothetical protein